MSALSAAGGQDWEGWAAQLPHSSMSVVQAALAEHWGGGALPPIVVDRNAAAGFTLDPRVFGWLRRTNWTTGELDGVISERAAGTGFSGKGHPTLFS